jgi:alpha-tubulin suppressor-like RCC1 family protein
MIRSILTAQKCVVNVPRKSKKPNDHSGRARVAGVMNASNLNRHRREALSAVGVGAILALGISAVPAGAHPSPTTAEHWGSYFGDFNKGDEDLLVSPTAITLPGTIAQVATSNSTEYALLTNGTVYAWGQGVKGELGNGGTANSFTTPVQVQFPAGVTIAYLPTDAMPYDTGLAVDTNGNSWGWGLNSQGQLCLGNITMQTVPVELPLHSVTSLAGAGDHAIYDSSGTVYGCGGNNAGDLGTGTGKQSLTPAKVVGVVGLPNVTVKGLFASFQSSGALLSNGEYFDWGANGQGQVGDGTTTNALSPVRVHLPRPVTQVAEGGSINSNGQTIVMLSNGTLRAWGTDTFSQLGDGGTTNQLLPIKIAPPAGVTYKYIASGGSTSYAVSFAGNVYAWGFGGNGQLGQGTQTNSSVPVLVDSGVSLISATAENVVVG